VTEASYRTLEVPAIRRERLSDRGHDRWSPDLLRGHLKLALRPLTPLHVGGPVPVPAQELGFKGITGLVRPFYRQGRRLVVPGSSLKGALRSLVEMFTYSCPVTDESKRCRGPAYCLACRVFGALGWQGQWFFSDGLIRRAEGQKVLRRRILRLPPQRLGHARANEDIRRYYPHRPFAMAEEDEYLVEALGPERVVVHTEVHFYNLRPEELGAVLIALGQGKPPLCLKLGGGKNAGLGTMQVHVTASTIWQGAEQVDKPLTDYVAQAQHSEVIDQGALTQLQADLGCPSSETGER